MIKVQVLSEHILSGKKHSSTSCSIALAIKNTAYFSNSVIMVEQITCFVGERNILHSFFTLPPEAVDFINKFDRGIEVKPFDFDIEDILGKQS